MAILFCGLVLVLSNLYATCPAAVAGLIFDVTEWCVEECDTSVLGDSIVGLMRRLELVVQNIAVQQLYARISSLSS